MFTIWLPIYSWILKLAYKPAKDPKHVGLHYKLSTLLCADYNRSTTVSKL